MGRAFHHFCLTCCTESLTILLWNLSTCSCHLGESPCLAPALLSFLWAQGLQPEDRQQLFPGIKHPDDEVTELPKWYRGKIRHPANNKYWKQDCFRASWELKSSGQIKSLTKIHLSVSPSADQQAHQHLVFSISFLLCQLFFTSCLLVMQ